MGRAGLAASLVTFVICGAISVWAMPANQAVEADRALGKWHSTEQFEGEPRIAVSFRKGDRSIEGWAVLLGQHRKAATIERRLDSRSRTQRGQDRASASTRSFPKTRAPSAGSAVIVFGTSGIETRINASSVYRDREVRRS